MIQYLEWDSAFFDKKIGRLDLRPANDKILETLVEAKQQNYDLLYIFTPEAFLINENDCLPFKGVLVDRKVVYSIDIISVVSLSQEVKEYVSTELTPELLNLAYESGKFSRFRLDKGFKASDFQRLYARWIEKSVTHEMADKVFVIIENNKIAGMVTLKISGNTSEIGLIAVDAKMQGKGYGKLLVERCISEAALSNCKTLSVPTQFENKPACKFYERCGFQVKLITNIYHFWL